MGRITGYGFVCLHATSLVWNKNVCHHKVFSCDSPVQGWLVYWSKVFAVQAFRRSFCIISFSFFDFFSFFSKKKCSGKDHNIFMFGFQPTERCFSENHCLICVLFILVLCTKYRRWPKGTNNKGERCRYGCHFSLTHSTRTHPVKCTPARGVKKTTHGQCILSRCRYKLE